MPDLEFNNYGETVRNTPSQTFFPKTVAEIQELVRFARSRGRRLRAAGMKHSWSDIFRWVHFPPHAILLPSDTGELLLYLLPLAVTDTISFARSEINKSLILLLRSGVSGMEEQLKDWGSELSFIEVGWRPGGWVRVLPCSWWGSWATAMLP